MRAAARRGAAGTLAGAAARSRTVARVNLYIVPRTRAWLSEEEIAAATDCVPAVIDTMREDLRCDPLLRRARGRRDVQRVLRLRGERPRGAAGTPTALRLPTDAIKPVAATIVSAPDPEPVRAA